ncbi:MAG TPA: PIG-L family deacetylase [Blastocatellia bacterium]|nr:PIG-L family deacetylase [Blastocatellia bacterium]HMV82375.1 PIG-L family deacetylase [Blastocatellia bacterium]HMX27670.1 PIG-L family deacetylase [Blastocatellia bacterium]HMZ22619.1 PIG-L family deacetylase [Blastocatellia bacterium]HNG30362.1 PIG-L family deacetylase [Blastocatellia bacterium]
MSEPNTLLAVFAHPDDESLVAGGTLAKYAAESERRRTALLCATRGDWGPISDDELADYSNLGEVRERELRAACEVLGISWLRFLDIEDACVSAVIGTEDEAVALEKIVRAIRELRPQTIITFGPDGLYGHPDHIAIGQLTAQACRLAADADVFPQHLTEGLSAHQTAELLFATAPQGLYSDLLAQLPPSAHLWGIPPESFGVPAETITAQVNIAPFWEQKLRALRCHRTQLDADHAFTLLTPELATELLPFEYFRAVEVIGAYQPSYERP